MTYPSVGMGVCTAKAVLHVIRCFNRSEDAIKDVMEKVKAEVWESDCYGA